MTPVITGDELRRRRKQHKLTQRALGDMLGVQPQAVSQWETGETVPDWVNAKKLEEIFGVPELTRLEQLEKDVAELRQAVLRILPPDDPLHDSPTQSAP